MRVYKILLSTKAEGPGTRACIWVQGCGHMCKGCFAKHLWNADEGEVFTAKEVIDKLAGVIDKIDGVTFLGGEPMDQADELAQVARYVKNAGKNTITFTGYIYEDLKASQDSGISELLKYTDLLADGPFVEELLDYSRPLLGSSNQRFIFLTDAIAEEEINKYHNSFEMRISSGGKLQVNGMGNLKELERYLEKIGGCDCVTNI